MSELTHKMNFHQLLSTFLVILSQVVGIYSVTFLEDTTLTKQQSITFQKFKDQVTPKIDKTWMKEDLYLLRFLRAKNFDLPRAVDFLNSHINWWKENMNSIEDEDWSDLQKDYHYDINGRDKEGRVILRWDIGDWDVRKQAVAGNLPRLLRYTFKMWHEANRKVDTLASQGQNVSRFIQVANLNNINAVQHINPTGIPYYLTVAATYDPHFPLMGDNLFLLNTPGLFQTVLTLIRPGLTESTRTFLRDYGKDPKVWKPILDQYVDESQLPPVYGGTLVE